MDLYRNWKFPIVSSRVTTGTPMNLSQLDLITRLLTALANLQVVALRFDLRKIDANGMRDALAIPAGRLPLYRES